MNHLRSLCPVLALLATLSLFPLGESRAASAPKVDLEKAKAELAKAKAAEKKKSESPPEVKPEPAPKPVVKADDKEEKKEAPRKKRLFSRREKKSEDKESNEVPEPKEIEEKKSESKESRSRPRMFKRDKDKPMPEESKEETVTEEKSDPGKLKRFSPFGRDKEKAQKPETAPAVVAPAEQPPKKSEAKPEIVDATSENLEQEDKPDTKEGRKRRLRGMFAKDSSTKKTEKAEEPAESEDEKSQGGSMFGIFRKDSTKEFARAEKTKLGKSLDSPAPASSTPVPKKTSVNAGELGWYVVTETKAPFYAVGPGQPMPPEKMLDRGSMLTVTKGGWGWCNVKLGSGELGVVSSKAMRPATVAEVSRHTSGRATASSSRGSRSLFNILSRGPAPKLDLPKRGSQAPIRNFGLLPPVDQ